MNTTVIQVIGQPGDAGYGISRAARNIDRILSEIHVAHLTVGPGDVDQAVRELPQPYVIVHDALPETPHVDMFILHTFLCAGSKLFRHDDHVCGHPIGGRCLFDWYAGPCGSHKSPLQALSSHSRALRLGAWIRDSRFTVAVASEYMRSYIMEEGCPADRVVAVPLYHPVRSTDERPLVDSERARTVPLAYVGRLSYAKGPQQLIPLLKADPTLTCDFVGEGYLSDDLWKAATQADVMDRCHLCGSLPFVDVDPYLRTVRVVAVPTLLPEPYGLIVGEARSAGCWVLAEPRGGLSEWATNDTGVVLVRFSDIPNTLAALKRALREPAPPCPDYGHQAAAAWAAVLEARYAAAATVP